MDTPEQEGIEAAERDGAIGVETTGEMIVAPSSRTLVSETSPPRTCSPAPHYPRSGALGRSGLRGRGPPADPGVRTTSSSLRVTSGRFPNRWVPASTVIVASITGPGAVSCPRCESSSDGLADLVLPDGMHVEGRAKTRTHVRHGETLVMAFEWDRRTSPGRGRFSLLRHRA